VTFRTWLGFVVAVLLAAPGAARGQIESHCLPEHLPMGIFPSWVLNGPDLACREVSAPLAHEKRDPGPEERDDSDIRKMLGLKAEPKGKADARSLSAMFPEARRVIQQAEAGRYRDAADAGDRLLRSPSERYNDYTRDYVANATAWSFIQLGQVGAAVEAHNLAAGRIRDTAVAFYHRLAAAALKETTKSPAQLKDKGTYRTVLREQLVERYKAFDRCLELAKSVRSAARRIENLKDAYDHLRVIMATDPGVAKDKAIPAFRNAADTLCTESISDILNEARQVRDGLARMYQKRFKRDQFGTWNGKVRLLQGKVRDVKKFCRMHDYLRRMGLASSRESARLFREAHGLLFAPGKGKQVWNPTLGYRIGIARELRKVIPADETTIQPM